MLANIVKELHHINQIYGWGRVDRVLMNETWTGGTVTIRSVNSEDTRSFRFDNATKTVYYLNHQAKINP